MRFSAPVILVFAATLAYGRWSRENISRRKMLVMVAGPLVAVAALVFFNREAIFDRYLNDPLWFIRKADDVKLVINVFASAIPSQVIPGCNLIYSRPPVIGPMDMQFAATRLDLAWTIVGLSVSALVIFGAWRSRTRFLPEILYVLAPFPLLAPIAPSVARYLASYQPFFWIFFYAGVAAVIQPHLQRARAARRISIIAAAAVALAVISLVAIRLRKVAGTANPSQAVSLLRAPSYVAGVAGPFRGLRQFIETLPPERTLLIGSGASTGRWTVISGREYYVPDDNLATVAKSSDVYLLSECGTLEACRDFDTWTRHLEDGVSLRGRFDFKPVFSQSTPQAQVAVFRLTALP